MTHRATGCFRDADLGAVTKVMSGLQSAVVDVAWNELVAEAQRQAPDAVANGSVRATLQSSLATAGNPFSVLWCTQEIEVDPTQPPQEIDAHALVEIDRLYAATKRTRPIPVHNDGAPVGKCGQCGRREAFGGSSLPSWREFQDRLDSDSRVADGDRIEVGERLCGTCLAKRLIGYAGGEGSFPSTSEIAAREWLRWVPAETLSAFLVAARRVPGHRLDPSPLFFERTLGRLENAAKASGDTTSQGRLTEAHAVRAALQESLAVGVPAQPPDYLAVLVFDGDSIGRRIQERPREVSNGIRRFSSDVVALLTASDRAEALAQVFYLGGDEGLLLAPLATALPLAQTLHDLFERALHDGGEAAATPITLSLGIAIFDRESPLGTAIAAAREALEKAKRLPSKNGLAVTVATASGSTFVTVDHWGSAWERLTTALGFIRGDKLSSGWAYDVESFLETLPPPIWEDPTGRGAIRAEVERLTRRRVVRGARPRDGETAAEAEERRKLEVWAALRGGEWFLEAPHETQLCALSQGLHLVAFLARALGAHAVEANP